MNRAKLEIPSWEEIRELRHTDPIVYAVLRVAEALGMAHEQRLRLLVSELSRETHDLRARLQLAILNQPVQIVLDPDSAARMRRPDQDPK